MSTMSLSPQNVADVSPLPNRVTMCLNFDNTEGSDVKENLKVYARVRPMLPNEEDAYTECVAAVDDETVRAVVPISSVKFKNTKHNGQEIYEDFKYTKAFGAEVGQYEFFNETIYEIMQGFIEGHNSLIFTYGITNSGKTFTLQGNDANPGIIPLAMHLFFGVMGRQVIKDILFKPDKFHDVIVLSDSEKREELKTKENLLKDLEEGSSKTSNSMNTTRPFGAVVCDCFRDDFAYETETTLPPEEMIIAQNAMDMRVKGKKCADEQSGEINVWVSFIEIYNEYVYDLLVPIVRDRQKLNLSEDWNGVYIKGAKEVCVSSPAEAIKLLQLGRRQLRIASTKLNYQSSRSHCIFTLKVVRVSEEGDTSCARVNRLSFCDLAGSERASKSQTTGLHLTEAGYINKSLMVLGRCLETLRINQTAKEKKMIPFRESKLTRLFSNHLLGRGKAAMIANASPCEYTFDETLNVLRFSALAKELTMNDSYLSMASSSLHSITSQWSKTKTSVKEVSHDESSFLDESMMENIQEKDEIIEKLLDLADSLTHNLEAEKRDKIDMEIKIREELTSDYAKYIKEIMDRQTALSERQLESQKRYANERYQAMKNGYEKRIANLMEALNESSEEESMNESLNGSKLQEKMKKLESLADTSSIEAEIEKDNKGSSEEHDTSMDCFETNADKSNEIDDYVAQIKTLTENLGSVMKELEDTKEKLQATNISFEDAKKVEAIAAEKNDSLNCQLLAANQVLDEYKTELDLLKASCMGFESDVEALEQEKKKLQEDISSLTVKLNCVQEKADSYAKELEKSKALEEPPSTVEVLKEQNSKFLELIRSIVSACNELDGSTNAFENLGETGAEVDEKFKVELERIEHLTDEHKLKLKDIHDDYSSLKKLLYSQKQRILFLEEQCITLQNEKNELYNKWQSETEKCDRLSKEQDDVRTELQQYRNEVDEALSDSKSKEALVHNECINLQLEIEKMRATVEKQSAVIASDFDEKVNILDENKRLNSEVNEAVEHLEKLKLQIAEVSLELETCKEKTICLESERDCLKAQLEEQCAIATDHSIISDEKELGVNKSEEMQCEIEGLKKTLEEQNAAIELHSITFEEKAKLQKENERLQAEVEEYAKKLDQQELEITDPEKEVLSRSRSEEMLNEIEGLKKTVEEQSTVIALHSATLEEKAQLLKENERLQSEAKDLVQTLDKQKVEIADGLQELIAFKEKVIKLEAEQEVIQDLTRQINEKEKSIEELEKALCDSQNLLKESEAKAKKQIQTLKNQYATDAANEGHLKKLAEAENMKLKFTISQLEKEIKGKQVSTESVKSKPSKETDPELSDAADAVQSSKENLPKSSKEKIKPAAEGARRKRERLPLRQKQVVSYADEEQGSDTDFEEEEEYKPKKGRKKAAAVKEQKPVSRKPSSRLLAAAAAADNKPEVRRGRRNVKEPEPENVSPVKKALAYVGSKIRSVVSPAPSPRVTRGRRKLFNTDTNTAPAWKF